MHFSQTIRLVIPSFSHKVDELVRPLLRIALWMCPPMVLVIVGAGCAEYEAKPLSPKTVGQRLTPPDAEALRVAASELRNPLLKPLPIDLSQPLSPDEAGVLAVLVSPDVRAERSARGVAAAQLLQAGILPNPTLNWGLDFPYNHIPGDTFTAYSFGVDWEITSLISHDAKVRAARTQAASVDLDVMWKEWQVAEAAKLAAYAVLSLSQQLEAAREIDQRLADNLAIVRRAYDQHQKTLLDLAAAESASQDAHAAVLSQQKELEHQKLVLNRTLGLASEQSVAIRASSLPSRLDPPTTQRALEGLEDRRLDLVALRKGYESQDATLRAAILQQFPKISLGPVLARDTSDVKTLGFAVTMDIPLFDRNQGAIAVEKATREKLFDEYVARVFNARADVATALSDIRRGNEQIAATEATVPQLEKLVQTYEQALRRGHADVLSYYTAQGSLAQKRIDVLKLKQQLVEDWVALEIASGLYLPQDQRPSQPQPTTVGANR
jgi:outer membrane protein TolC